MIRSPSVQETYDRCSSFYDLFFKPWLECGRQRAVELLELRNKDDLLEIGVGTGLSFPFYPFHIRVVGFDFSEGMLRQSKPKAQSDASCPVDLVQMDVQHMAFPDNSFDRVMAAYVLTVVPDPRKALEEIFRVAKPGAKVVLMNHLRSPNRLWSSIEDTFHPLFSRIGLFTLDRDLLELIRSFHPDDLATEPTSIFGIHHLVSFTVPTSS